MDFWIVLGAVGAVASIAGLLLPASTRNQRAVHVVYGLAIALLASVAAWYWHENRRVKSIERAASALVERALIDYTHEGFAQAALAFLEKNRDIYPDSYARAQELVSQCECRGVDGAANVVTLSFTLQGLLRGIGTLETGA